MKIVSFNINSIRARPHQIQAIVKKHNPDAIGLQETKVHDDEFPHEIADGEPKKERVVKSYVLDLLGQNLQFFARSIKKEKADDKK